MDLPEVVSRLRKDRGGMMEFPINYMFIHKVLTMYSIEHGTCSCSRACAVWHRIEQPC